MSVLVAFCITVFCFLVFAEAKNKKIRALTLGVGMMCKVWVLTFLVLAFLKAM